MFYTLTKSKKAQVGTEMLFGIGVIFLIFILLIPISINKSNDVRDTSDFLERNEDCKTFVNSLARVAATENLKVVNEFKHNIQLEANKRIVDVEGVLCTSLISFPESQSLQKGKIEIKNVDGEIIASNI